MGSIATVAMLPRVSFIQCRLRGRERAVSIQAGGMPAAGMSPYSARPTTALALARSLSVWVDK